MSETKFFKQKKHSDFSMGELLQLNELAQEFAKELDISLEPRPLDDTVTSFCTYWMTGTKEDYTLDHTLLVDDEGNYTVVTEEIRIGQDEEYWKTIIVTHPSHKEFLFEYLGHRSQAEVYKEKLYQLSDEMPFELFKKLLAELHVVTDSKYLDREKQMRGDLIPNEDINVIVESFTLDDFKKLPKFIKNFYS